MADADVAPGLSPSRVTVRKHDEDVAVFNLSEAVVPAVISPLRRGRVLIDPNVEDLPAENT